MPDHDDTSRPDGATPRADDPSPRPGALSDPSPGPGALSDPPPGPGALSDPAPAPAATPAPGEPGDAAVPSFNDQFRAAVANTGLGKVAPGEAPSGRALVAAVGGVRGLAESVLPGLAFLVVYAITKELVPSVVIPVVIGFVFVVLRLLQRQSLTMSFAGILGVAISAGLALITGKAENNFIPGIIINVVWLVGLLVTLAIRRPLIGIIVGFLLPPNEDGSHVDWRADPAKRRVLTVATWVWVGLFAVRLVIEIPLYLTAQVELLAGIKLITGVPLYAAVLWVTWLLVRTVFRREGDAAAV